MDALTLSLARLACDNSGDGRPPQVLGEACGTVSGGADHSCSAVLPVRETSSWDGAVPRTHRHLQGQVQ